MKRPSFQFYPGDWRKDPELSSCSLAARGLWIELLCIAHESTQYGHLSINDKPMTVAQLARLVGETPAVVAKLLSELEGAGVFSRTENGTIYSRRMVADEHIRTVRAAAGRFGGNPNLVRSDTAIDGYEGLILLKQKDKQNDNHRHKQEPTPSSSSSSSSSEKEEAIASLSPAKPDDLPPCPHAELLDLFADRLPALPQPRRELWTGQREKHLTARWRWVLTARKRDGTRYAADRAEALAWFDRFFRYVGTCPHLVGENDRGWTADLAWLTKAENFAKVVQGNYDRRVEVAA